MALEREKEHEINIPLMNQDVMLKGSLYVPQNAQGLILFAHGSGSGRFSPRNRFVAQYLTGALCNTAFDLLTRSKRRPI